MKIRISDKQVQHALELSSEEIVSLLRYKTPKGERTNFEVISPILLVLGDKKFQVTITKVSDFESTSYSGGMFLDEEGREWGSDTDAGDDLPKNPKSMVSKIPSFIMRLELTPDVFAALSTSKEVLVLFRVNNVPVYTETKQAKVDFNLAEGTLPGLEIKVDRVKPIVDLLKAQISEDDFYNVFIVGKSDEFFDKGGRDLDELVGLIGVKRKIDESDIALRTRVKEYLQIRMAQLSKVKDEELERLISEEAEKDRIQKQLDNAKEKRKKEKTDGDK